MGLDSSNPRQPMDVDLAILCDAATIDASGKLNILGIFDRIGVRSFPARHGRLSLVLRFSGGIDETGSHDLEIALRDPDGGEVVRADGQMRLGARPGSVRSGLKVPQVLNFDGIVFQSPGDYVFDVTVDGDHQVMVPLQVMQVSTAEA